MPCAGTTNGAAVPPASAGEQRPTRPFVLWQPGWVDKGRAFILSKHFQAAAQLTTGACLSVTGGNGHDWSTARCASCERVLFALGYYCFRTAIGNVPQCHEEVACCVDFAALTLNPAPTLPKSNPDPAPNPNTNASNVTCVGSC